MKNLCVFLLLLSALPSVRCIAQQIALLDAPEAASGPSLSSSSSAGGSGILPVRGPAADAREGFARTDWALLGAGAALRFLDYKSTVKSMTDPVNFREVELPQALVHNRPAFGAFEASTVVVNYYAYRLFIEHRHRKLARLGQAINLAAMGWTVGRNYYELNEFWPKANIFHEDYAVRH